MDAIMEIAEKFPQMSLTVNAADLAAFADALISSSIERGRAAYEAQKKAESEELYLSEHEAGKMLGVCPRTLARWREKGYIQAVQVGGRIKYKKSECRRILNEKNTEE